MNLHREDILAIETNMTSRAQRQERTEGYVAELHEPAALSLGEQGLIQDCNKSLEKLFGFRRSELVWQHVSKLFPQLAGVEFVQSGQVNPLLKYLCRCGHLYQAQNRQGDCFSSSLSIFRLEYEGIRSLRMIVRPSGGVGA
jgi:PAS domain-containing protein